MANWKRGKQSFVLPQPPVITAWASVAGKREAEGPLQLARRDGLSLGGKLMDCGTLVFDPARQDVHAGGSGCGCSAITLWRDGLSLGGKLMDCGTLVFDPARQDVHAGGSGCGCSAITLCGTLLEELRIGKVKKLLFCGTGALLSPTSTQQSLPIPGICHAVSVTGGC